jgi:cytochrome P450
MNKTSSSLAAERSMPVWLPTERNLEHPLDPPGELGQLRASEPVSRLRFPDGHIGWLVTSHELGRAVLGDRRFTNYPGGVPEMQANRAAILLDGIQRDESFPSAVRAIVDRYQQEGRLSAAFRDPEVVRTLHERPLRNLPYATLMDPPEHTRLRRTLARYFTVRRVAEHRAVLEQIIAECLDGMERAGAPVDLVEAFALPIPSLLTCHAFDVPVDERGTFERLTMTVTDPSAPVDVVVEAVAEFRAFVGELIERKRAQPAADDLLSGLVHSGELSDVELVAVAIQLVRTSHWTTAALISTAVLALLQDRDRWNELKAQSAPIRHVVEELLRYTTIAPAADVRTALEDVELDGVVIKAFDHVVVSYAAANRDPDVFADPDRVDLTRESAVRHIAFGYGPHQCVGQHQARLELQVALPALVERFPTLDLAVPVEDVPWLSGDGVLWGPKRLMVAW